MQYGDYARVYDRSGQMQFSILMGSYMRDLLRTHPVDGTRLLDVGCGTGTLALIMAERGWTATGIDRSTAMLDEARRKAERAQIGVRFMEGDLRSFAVDAPVDLVTCFYDTLNYLLEPDDLRQCLAAVRRALLPGGLFCFDLATEYFLRTYWQGVDFQEFETYSQVMQSYYDEDTRCSTLVLTGFTDAGNGSFRRFREVHVERAYPEPVIDGLLREQDFDLEAVYDCFTMQPPNDRSLREMYVARRRG